VIEGMENGESLITDGTTSYNIGGESGSNLKVMMPPITIGYIDAVENTMIAWGSEQ
jgi:hypothetical protein